MDHSHHRHKEHSHAGEGHGHGHGHSHGVQIETMDQAQRFAFRWGIILNFAFCLVEGGIGWMTDSMALMADAVHNFTDVLSLILAWVAFIAATRPGSSRFTYGFKRGTVLAAFINGLLLLVTCLFLAGESIHRFFSPEPVQGLPLILAASVGILINGYTAWLFTKTSKTDINARGAFIHLAADAAVSVGVVASGFIIMKTGQSWIDPVAGLLIVGIILKSTWSLLLESILQLFDGVPSHISLAEVRSFLEKLTGVESVHDLHIWNLSTNLTACSAHLQITATTNRDQLLIDAAEGLKSTFGIAHPTLQLENVACTQECTHP